jgi:spermidine synthase
MNKSQEMKSQLNGLLLLSFIEGACVMVAELAGGKILAPFYGTSIYVWASTLAVTLGGLAVGYFLGGRFSQLPGDKRRQRLFTTIAIGAALVIIMPMWAKTVMQATMDMDFLTGLVVSQITFLLLPIIAMGIVSPLIIGLISEQNESGKAAGMVYAISTVGGILGTMLAGFWLVPVVGISIPCIVAGALLLVVAFLVLRPGNKLPAAMLLALVPAMLHLRNERSLESDKYSLLYYSEGVLGQVKVVEFQTSKKITTRVMLVNHNWQTWIDANDPSYSFLYYTRFTKGIIGTMPKGSKALLIGLGGGTVARQFEQQGIDYDAVEIDGRLPRLAKEYFGLKGSGRLIVDDGRHFINKCKTKYDLVVIDALLGENVPSHLLSIECFEKVKNLLTDNGKIFIEFDGVEEGETGEAQKRLYNTIVKAGLACRTYSSVPNTASDVMYVAAKKDMPEVGNIRIEKDQYYNYEGPLSGYSLLLENGTPEILTDDQPTLDYLLKTKMAYVRNEHLKKQNQAFLDHDFMFYY